MNCFEFRRLMLADPRQWPEAMQQHRERCANCARLAKQMEGFETAIHEAATVPVPEALADRILLRHKPARSWLPQFEFGAWAFAAVLVLAVAVTVHFYDRPADNAGGMITAESLGSNHPAVAAINYVLDFEPALLRENQSGDPAVLTAALEKMHVRLPKDGKVRYLGKCPVPGGQGEHVVLNTPDAQFSLILVPDQRYSGRVLVSDRNMVALAAPASSGTGSVILVTNSMKMLTVLESKLM